MCLFNEDANIPRAKPITFVRKIWPHPFLVKIYKNDFQNSLAYNVVVIGLQFSTSYY